MTAQWQGKVDCALTLVGHVNVGADVVSCLLARPCPVMKMKRHAVPPPAPAITRLISWFNYRNGLP